MIIQRFNYSNVILMLCMVVLVATSHIQAGTFRDDFEDGNLDGWRQEAPLEEKPTLWRVVDGELECTRKSNFSTVLITGEETWTDYIIECQVKLLEDFGPGDVDIIARRIQGEEPGLLFGVGDFAGGPEVFVNDMPTVNPEKKEPFKNLKLNEWYHLKVKAEDDTFTFWVNGEEALGYRNNMVVRGSVGLGLANYTAHFDNVEISGPGVPDVTPPTWSPVQSKRELAAIWGEIKRSLFFETH